LQGPPKFTSIGNFWFENMPSGNPVMATFIFQGEKFSKTRRFSVCSISHGLFFQAGSRVTGNVPEKRMKMFRKLNNIKLTAT
jgi:hypothetical protein